MKKVIILAILILYVCMWFYQKDRIVWSDSYLSRALPAKALTVASGYGGHVAAFLIFIKTAVFAGGTLVGVEEEDYVPSLVQNFDVASELFPEFVDLYFFCQAFVPHVAPEYARKTNQILLRAEEIYPDSLYYPFFRGFNYYKYLDEPLLAAEVFRAASMLPDAPPLFASMGSRLMARGGNLAVGREMLVVMYRSETNEAVRERYAAELENFDKALSLQAALDRYRQVNGVDAHEIDDVVPSFMESVPDLSLGYVFAWEPPVLKMVRPQ